MSRTRTALSSVLIVALVAAMLATPAQAEELDEPQRDHATSANEGLLGPAATGEGYWMLGDDGEVYPFGDAVDHGDATNFNSSRGYAALVPTPDAGGYWILSGFGTLLERGNAPDLPSPSSLKNDTSSFAAAAATTTGNGLWTFTETGQVIALGDATHHGDLHTLDVNLNGSIVDAAVTPSGGGYWLLGSEGGIFAFGDATFHGSIQGVIHQLGLDVPAEQWLNAPIVGLVPTATNDGYWLVASDGGIFAFGQAPFRGSVPGVVPGPLAQPVNGMVPYGNGYLMVASDGGVFTFSDKPFLGSLGGQSLGAPITGITPVPGASVLEIPGFTTAEEFVDHPGGLRFRGVLATDEPTTVEVYGDDTGPTLLVADNASGGGSVGFINGRPTNIALDDGTRAVIDYGPPGKITVVNPDGSERELPFDESSVLGPDTLRVAEAPRSVQQARIVDLPSGYPMRVVLEGVDEHGTPETGLDARFATCEAAAPLLCHIRPEADFDSAFTERFAVEHRLRVDTSRFEYRTQQECFDLWNGRAGTLGWIGIITTFLGAVFTSPGWFPIAMALASIGAGVGGLSFAATTECQQVSVAEEIARVLRQVELSTTPVRADFVVSASGDRVTARRNLAVEWPSSPAHLGGRTSVREDVVLYRRLTAELSGTTGISYRNNSNIHRPGDERRMQLELTGGVFTRPGTNYQVTVLVAGREVARTVVPYDRGDRTTHTFDVTVPTPARNLEAWQVEARVGDETRSVSDFSSALVAKDCIYDQIVRANQQSVNGAAHDDTEICAAPIDVDVSGGGTFAAGTEVDFDVTINAGTVDSNGDYTLLVNFGDGSSRTIAVRETFPTTRTTVSHTYDVPGEYEVTVEARDSVGLSDDTLDFVQIGSDLQGRITDAPTFVELGNAAFIRVEAEGGWFPGADKRYEVVMNYGDGTVASGFFNFDLDRQPLVLSGNYTYDEPGEYDVVMTLRDGTSREIRRTRRIEVRPPADCTEVGPGCPALPIQAGQWASTYGTGPLRQVGNTIEYRYDSQDGRIVDTVYNPSTRVLTGYWAEPSAARQCDTSRDGTRYWGRIIWTFAADGKSFSGSWSYCDAEPAAGWSGSLVE